MRKKTVSIHPNRIRTVRSRTYLYLQILAVISFSLLNFRELRIICQNEIKTQNWKESTVPTFSSFPFFGYLGCYRRCAFFFAIHLSSLPSPSPPLSLPPLFSLSVIYLIVFIASVMWCDRKTRADFAPHETRFVCVHALTCIACVELQKRYKENENEKKKKPRLYKHEKQRTNKKSVQFPWARKSPPSLCRKCIVRFYLIELRVFGTPLRSTCIK